MAVETVELQTPVGRDWAAVVRLVLGGIGDRLGLGFDDVDDLQLAVERLLAEAGQQSVRLTLELSEGRVRATVGPLAESTLAEALKGAEPPPGDLTLRRILSTVVDSYGVERVEDAGLHVRLEKATRGAA